MKLDEKDYLAHYGVLRRSGRYPWGSGGPESGGNKNFLDYADQLKKSGMSESEIATAFDTTIAELRTARSIAKNAQRREDVAMARRLQEKGYSNIAIGKRMGKNESTVRSLLDETKKDRLDILHATADMLRKEIDEKRFIDVGAGVENHLGISKEKLKTAIAVLKDEGYRMHYPNTIQLGTGKKTSFKILAHPDVLPKEVYDNVNSVSQISQIQSFSKDSGRSWLGIHPPLSISSKRVAINYAEDGGTAADGVLYIRPGVKDVSIGGSRYAQVRVAVDGTHYLKGMAVYKEDLPAGVDIVFNTNKSNTGNKLDAMKPLKTDQDGSVDKDNPFGAVLKANGQRTEFDKNGKEVVTSSMNILHEEGDWSTWAKTLSAQTLSKQSPTLAKGQLNMFYESKKNELDGIMALTNPAVRQKLLDDFATNADAASVHLKAAKLPRSSWHVILPIPTMSETEIYAPNFRNGEKVALIRYPHGGKFEIPELTVNNNQREAKASLGRAQDAVGIHPNVAARLSGADFDGDSVLVIPNNSGAIKTQPALEGLKSFDAKLEYAPYDGMRTIDGGRYNAATKKVDYGGRNPTSSKQNEMGKITNLIADMTIRKAGTEDLARAVKHSMVVIDAEKHTLDYQRSARDNGIPALKEKYQGRSDAGASTLITLAKSKVYVDKNKPRRAKDGGPIERTTGKLKFEPDSADKYTNAKGEVIVSQRKSKRLAETDDAHTLSSGTLIEKVYADHSNRLKALANEARKQSINTSPIPYSPTAKLHYANEVDSLNAKLNQALKNAPLERQAQLVGDATYKMKLAQSPSMDPETKKKIRGQALVEARVRVGAKKAKVEITDREWEAIQAGAISHSKLRQVLNNSDLDEIKKLATPRIALKMTSSKSTRAKQMIQQGYTQADIADALGVSVTTLKTALGTDGGG